MGSLSHITLSNSIHYNCNKPGEQEGNLETDYEPVNTNTRNRESSLPTITSYPRHIATTPFRIDSRRAERARMKNSAKATYLCCCVTVILALQIWTVIMMKYVETRLTRIVIKNDNLPIQKQYNIPGSLNLISSKLDSIFRDTNYNIPYLIINRVLPKDYNSARPKGIYLAYGTSMQISIPNYDESNKGRKSKKKDKRDQTMKLEIKFDDRLTEGVHRYCNSTSP
ncbi:hypothetical protein [Wufeng Rhinolophus pearsonii paramyxovirus 1]|uniref:Uncharacterized protein n=1 Tax=Wufeng Rhinolophus pearsonii paramyxovirus 1 TaxID=2877502 RepID=A0AAE8XRS8_9MONO|nr:hypothetical protein [Wufeng Rhinolophus pearsonii paramyxovirus 1]